MLRNFAETKLKAYFLISLRVRSLFIEFLNGCMAHAKAREYARGRVVASRACNGTVDVTGCVYYGSTVMHRLCRFLSVLDVVCDHREQEGRACTVAVTCAWLCSF